MRVKRNKEKYTSTSGSKAKGYSSRALILTIALLYFSSGQNIFAQANVTTVGIQYKPIFSTDIAGGGTQSVNENGLQMGLTLERGSSFGLIIRKGLTKSLSIETGINSVNRRFRLDFEDLDSNFLRTIDFKFTNYEIPVQGLIYIRVGENSWINTSLGLSLNSYPGNVESTTEYFSQGTARHRKFQLAMVANIGYEYRTKKSGYWYLGASFYNPFNRIGHTTGFYQTSTVLETISMDINGNYLTLDLRYFFHERPEKN